MSFRSRRRRPRRREHSSPSRVGGGASSKAKRSHKLDNKVGAAIELSAQTQCESREANFLPARAGTCRRARSRCGPVRTAIPPGRLRRRRRESKSNHRGIIPAGRRRPRRRRPQQPPLAKERRSLAPRGEKLIPVAWQPAWPPAGQQVAVIRGRLEDGSAPRPKRKQKCPPGPIPSERPTNVQHYGNSNEPTAARDNGRPSRRLETARRGRPAAERGAREIGAVSRRR
jgi:hypothetical protein